MGTKTNALDLTGIYGDVVEIPKGFIGATPKARVIETKKDAHARLKLIEQALRFAGHVPS